MDAGGSRAICRNDMQSLVIGSSGGIGSAVAAALASRGEPVVTLSRRDDGFDVTDEAAVEAAAARLPGPFRLIFDATGALTIGHPPEKTIAALSPAAMAEQFALNAIGPALLLKHFHPRLAETGRSVFATLSARVGSIGDNRLGGWISYRAAKAALNQVVRTAAIEISRRRPEAVVVALHPGTVDTALSRPYAGHAKATPDAAAANLLGVLDGLGRSDTGGFFAWDGTPVPW